MTILINSKVAIKRVRGGEMKVQVGMEFVAEKTLSLFA